MMKMIPFCALYLPYLVALPALIAWFRCRPLLRRSLLLRGVTALSAAVALGLVANQGYADIRPFAQHHSAPLFYHIANNGFPLWQTVFTATVAFVLMPYWRPAAYFSLFLAFAVSWANVAARVNSPKDAVAGFVVGAVASLVARGLVRRAEKKRHLYPPERVGGSNGREGASVSSNGSQSDITSVEAASSRSSSTVSEFDSRVFLGYTDSFHSRN